MTAVIDLSPYVPLTLVLRNLCVLTSVILYLEIVTHLPRRIIAAESTDFIRGVFSFQLFTSFGQLFLGGWMVAPMLAVLEAFAGRRRRTQSGRGNQEGGKMHFEGAE